MYIIKNALRSISRSKGRNILIGIIIFVISLSSCLALSIREAAKSAQASALDDLEITASISPDRKSMMDSFEDRDAMKEAISLTQGLSLEELEIYAEAESVKNFYYTYSASMNGSSIEAVDSTGIASDEADSAEQANDQPGMGPGQDRTDGGMQSGNLGTQGDFTLSGYSSDEAMTDFIDGISSITSGSMFTEGTADNTCVISEELAAYNDLSVGDTITLYSLDTQREDVFEIVGIFSGTEGMSKDAMMADGIPANQGYIDMNSYQKMWNETTLELGSLDVYVDSAENVQDVLETIQNLPEIKDKTFTYSTDTENFDLISNPLSSIQTMVGTAVVVIAVTGAVIIVLLLVLWTRGRKKEAGILIAVGRSKLEIVLQFLMENILIAIPAVAASLGLTTLLADKVGAYLVSQTASDITRLSVTIHSSDIVAVYGVGALILILAVLLAAVTVIRLKPREILSQMD